MLKVHLLACMLHVRRLKQQKKVFNDLDKQNVVSWNSLLGVYAQSGYGYEVMKLFSNMKSYGFHPVEFTYTSTLNACACFKFLEGGQ